MRQLIDYFDRAYIINLRDRPDRRSETIREFARIGVDVPHDKISFYTATRPSEKAEFPSLGARGSFTSHKCILGLALTAGLNNVLIFEDDVHFRTVDDRILEQILDQLRREPWDVVYFGYMQPPQGFVQTPLSCWSNDTIGGHFYGVNGTFVEQMYKYMQECETRPRDHPDGGPTFRDGAYNNVRRKFPELRVLLAGSNLATQRSSRTDLHPLKIFDRLTWTRPFVDMLRVVKNRVRSVRELR